MNKNYRLIWSHVRQSWSVAPEIAKARRRKRNRRSSRISAVALLSSITATAWSAPPTPTQLPTGGTVSAGSVNISQGTGAVLNVNQASSNAVIDWTTFNLGSAAQVNFNQPSANAVTLNRVLDTNPSQILGRIVAPGQVILSNPNGVYFGASAQVDVGAFVATTDSITNTDLMAGKLHFSRNGSTGSVVNDGELHAALGGYIALLAPEVLNDGVIIAQAGTVALAAGEQITLNFGSGNSLTGITVTPAAIKTLVENRQAVLAPAGLIILSARAANELQGSVVNSGTVSARSLVSKGGRIVLEGDNITLSAGSSLDASGATGGGTVLVGGDLHGSDNGADPMYQATTVTMAPDASINVSATQNGKGGTAVLWSDVNSAASSTNVQGTVTAKGAGGGAGGQIETSGHALNVEGSNVNAGVGGDWLLDPYNVTITNAAAGSNVSGGTVTSTSGGTWAPSASGSQISNGTIVAALNNGQNVTVTTTNAGGSEAGNITVTGPIAMTGASNANLTLSAAGSIALNAGISSSGGQLATTLNAAAGNVAGAGAINTNGGLLTVNAATAGTLSGVISGSGGLTSTGAGTLTLTGSNTYTGATTVAAGGLTLDSTNTASTALMTVASGATATIASGSGTFQSSAITVAGTLSVTGTNPIQYYSSTLTIESGGVVTTNVTGENIGVSTGTINMQGGSTLTASGSGSWTLRPASQTINVVAGGSSATAAVISAPIQLTNSAQSANGVFNVANITGGGVDLSVTSVIQVDNNIGITKTGAGTMAMTAANTYTGPTTVSNGTLIATVNTSFNALNTGAASIASGARLEMNNTSTATATNIAINNTFSGAGTLNLNFNDPNTTGTSTPNITGFTGNVLLTSTGATGDKWDVGGTGAGLGTLPSSVTVSSGTTMFESLGGSNFTGGISVVGSGNSENRGAIRVDNGTMGGNISLAGNATIASAGTATLTGTISDGTSSPVTLTVGTSVATNSPTLSGNISNGSGVLGITSVVSATLSGANSYTGATNVNSGTLTAGSASAFGSNSAVTVASGATVNLAGNSVSIGSLSGAGTVTDSGVAATLTNGGLNASTTFSGVITNGSNALALTEAGTGTLTLTGTNTYYGTTTISAGTLQIGNGGTGGTIGSGNIVDNGSLVFNTSSAQYVYGAISGSGGVTQNGAGTVYLSSMTAPALYGGPNNGTALQLTMNGNNAGFITYDGGFSSPLTLPVTGMVKGSTFQIFDNSTESPTVSSSGTNLGSSLALSTGQSAGFFYNGTTWIYGGLLPASSTNTYTGATIVNAGTLAAGKTTAFGTNSAVTVASGANLDLAGFNNSIGSLAGAGTVTNSGAAATLTTGGNNTSTTFSGIIQNGAGALSLSMSGTGTQSLSGVNTYTGATTVSAGTLQISGAGTLGSGAYAGNISIASGAMLEDSSTAAQILSGAISGAGTLQMDSGNSSLTLTNNNSSLSGNVNVNSGSLLIGAGGATGGVGTAAIQDNSNVQVNETGTLVIGGVISGSGTLGQVGSGTTTLEANNTYAGTTTISGGTLQVGAGGAAGSLGTGAVVDNSNLYFNMGVNTTLPAGNAVTGSGNLYYYSGSGSLTTNNAITLSGYVYLEPNGTLTVEAPISSGSFMALTSSSAGVTLNANASTTGGASSAITIGAASDIIQASNTTVQTNGASITYDSRSGNALNGGITINSGDTIDSRTAADRTAGTNTTGGGAILLSGGSTPATGYAQNATGQDYGLSLGNNVQILSGSGNIGIRGAMTQVENYYNAGVVTDQNFTINAGTNGNIAIAGVGTSTNAGNTMNGIWIYYAGSPSTELVKTVNGNINLTGTAANTSNNYGLNLQDATIEAVGSGSVTLTGSGSTNGVVLQNTNVLAASGPIAITDTSPNGDQFSVAGAKLGSVTGSDVTASSSTVLLQGDQIAFSNTNAINTSGAVTLQSNDPSFGAALSVPSTLSFSSNVSSLTVGRTTNTADITFGGNVAIAGPITAFGGNLNVDANLSSSAGSDLLEGLNTVTMASSNSIAATNGDIVLVAGRFVNNNASASTLSAGGSGNDWQVWSTNASPFGGSTPDVAGGLVYNYKQYDATYGVTAVQGTGNGMLYSLAPTLTATLGGSASKTYDTTNTASVANLSLTNISGLVGGDTIGLTSATYSDPNVGTGKTVTADLSAVASNGGAPVYGYQIPATLSAAVGTITPANLLITGVTANNKVYDATTADTLTGGSITPLGSDAVTLNSSGAEGTFATKNVGTGIAVTASGYTISGAEAGNYTLVEPTGLTANITPASLLITGVTANNKVYDSTTADTLSGGNISALGSDSVTLNTSGAAGTFATKNVGTGIAVTASGFTISGTDAGNYTLVEPSGLTANITPASLLVSGVTANNKVYDATTADTLSGGSVSALGSDSVTLNTSAATGTFATKNIGTGIAVTASGYTISGTDAGNYTLVEPAGLTANITPASLLISGVTANNKVYDATTADTLTGGSITALGSDSVTLNTSGATGTFASKNVGTGIAVSANGYTISGTDAGNYTLVEPTGLTANITPASLLISGVTANNKVYDATTADTLTGGSIAALGSDSVKLNTSAATGTFATKNVGTGIAVSASGYTISGTDAGNYTLVEPSGLTANITPASLLVSGVTANNKVYDTTTADTLTGGSITALGSDSVTLNTSAATGTFASKNVGTGIAVTASGYTISGTDASNYTLVEPSGLTANITPASLLISGVTANNKVYDATTADTLTGGSITALGSDSVTLNTSGAAGTFATKNVGTGIAVTANGYTISGTDAGNYTLVEPAGLTANITPASLLISGVTANNKVYDSTTADTLTGGGISALGSDSVTLNTSAATGTFATKNVGTGIAVTAAGYTISGAGAGNYSLIEPTGLTANITPASLLISGVTANNKVYDATTADSLTGGSITALGSDSVTLNTSSAAGTFATKNVGTGIAVSAAGYTISGADAGNYTLVEPTGLTANITPANLLVSGVTANNKVYDSTTSDTLSGGTVTALGSDSVTLNGGAAVGAFANPNVGTSIAVTASGYTLSGADAGNYTLIEPTGLSASITPRPVTVSGLTADNKVYDATTAVTISNWGTVATGISGQTLTLNTGTAAFADPNAGTGKTVTATGYTLSNGTGQASNYQLSSSSATTTADITPAALTVSANNDVKIVTQADPTGFNGVSYSGFVDGQTAAVLSTAPTVTRTNGGDGLTTGAQGAGTYTGVLVASGASAANYTISYAPGNFTIVPADQLLVQVQNTSGVYGTSPAPYTITSAQYLNSSGVISTLTQVGASGNTFTYSDGVGGLAVFTLSPTGAVLSTGGHLAAGNYAVNGTNTSIVGSNFNALNFVGEQTVTQAAVTPNVSSGVSKVYDGTTAMNGVTLNLSGQQAGDAVTVNGNGAYASRNAGTGLSYTIANLSLSGSDAGDYYLSTGGAGSYSGTNGVITPALLAVTGVTAANKVYDTTTADALSGGSIAALGSDSVTLNTSAATGTFATKNVGNGIAVMAGGYTISGADAGNYSLVEPTGLTANITPASLAISGVTANNKVYDSTTADTLSGGTITALGSDSVTLNTGSASGTFASKNVGTGIAVTASGYTISGTDAGNYTLVEPTGLTANITPASLLISGATANNKVYDSTTADTLSGGSITALGSDSVTLNSSAATGAFATKNVGTGIAVTASGYTISGTDASNYTLVEPSGLTANITPASLLVSGVTANNKVYDSTMSGTLSGGSVTALGSDSVTLNTSGAVGTFATKNVGTSIVVTANGYTISGTDAGNYTLVEPTGLTANITPASLLISGVTANNKVYDTTTADTLSGGHITALGSDSVTLSTGSATGTFATKNVGTDIALTASGYTISGADAGNYTLVEPTGLTANITPASLVISGVTANNKVYDSTTTDTLLGGSVTALGSDSVTLNTSAASGKFATKNVGTDIAVTAGGYTISGADADNYTLIDPTGLTASITPRPLTLTGDSGVDKVVDGTTALPTNDSGHGALSGVLGNDQVNLIGTAQYDSAAVGPRSIVEGTIALTGAEAADYSLTWINGSGTIFAPITTPSKVFFPPQPLPPTPVLGTAILTDLTISSESTAMLASSGEIIQASHAPTLWSDTHTLGTMGIRSVLVCQALDSDSRAGDCATTPTQPVN